MVDVPGRACQRACACLCLAPEPHLSYLARAVHVANRQHRKAGEEGDVQREGEEDPRQQEVSVQLLPEDQGGAAGLDL